MWGNVDDVVGVASVTYLPLPSSPLPSHTHADTCRSLLHTWEYSFPGSLEHDEEGITSAHRHCQSMDGCYQVLRLFMMFDCVSKYVFCVNHFLFGLASNLLQNFCLRGRCVRWVGGVGCEHRERDNGDVNIVCTAVRSQHTGPLSWPGEKLNE